MKFVPTRALRINPGEVWRLLEQERDLVITSNGKPVGILTLADEDSLEDVLATLRQGRAQAAVAEIRRVAVGRGPDRLTQRRVQEVVQKTRKPRRSSQHGGPSHGPPMPPRRSGRPGKAVAPLDILRQAPRAASGTRR